MALILYFLTEGWLEGEGGGSLSHCSLFALKADGQVQINRINQWEIRGQSAGNELRLQQISGRDYTTLIIEKDAAENARDRAELTYYR